jgi:hypothetical protein
VSAIPGDRHSAEQFPALGDPHDATLKHKMWRQSANHLVAGCLNSQTVYPPNQTPPGNGSVSSFAKTTYTSSITAAGTPNRMPQYLWRSSHSCTVT